MAEDIRMNKFQTATDADYFYAEDRDGNQVKIKKDVVSNLLKELIPTYGYTRFIPNQGRWQRILNMSSPGECFLSFLYTGGSYTNAEVCSFIVNIMWGAQKQLIANRISSNRGASPVSFRYKFAENNLKIWINGTYTAQGAALINLSSEQIPFEFEREDPPSDSVEA